MKLKEHKNLRDDLPDFTKLELVPSDVASHADLLVLRDQGERMRVMDEDELAQRRAEAIRWSHSETLPLLMHGR